MIGGISDFIVGGELTYCFRESSLSIASLEDLYEYRSWLYFIMSIGESHQNISPQVLIFCMKCWVSQSTEVYSKKWEWNIFIWYQEDMIAGNFWEVISIYLYLYLSMYNFMNSTKYYGVMHWPLINTSISSPLYAIREANF